MRFLPLWLTLRSYYRLIFIVLLLFSTFRFLINPLPVLAVEPTPTPAGVLPATTAQWAFDPETTEVGKGADRARQLLWWVLSHPAIYWSPVLATIWAFSRNIVYVSMVLVIVALGLGLILGKKGRIGPIFSGISSPVAGINVPSILLKVGAILLYVTFSYLFILAMIQASELTIKFVTEFVGGKDLFNVIFYGSGNSEANYTTFIGYRDVNLVNQEMANTSLLMVRLTSFTYYVISIIMILRAVILWFLLCISPFLALLMPFIFIRNMGWIWIGVFFQWLFYGPLFILFLSAVTRIWVFGIPYSFNFSRVNKPEGQVYRTAINILYGGPAQTLGPGNTANYIDTYAEYVIALVMLWAALILPWWLLRIFRDYCCEMIASGNSTLQSIFDRIRQYPPPTPPSAIPPTSTSGMATELPFRQRVEEKIREVERMTTIDISEITRENTTDIARSMDISVSSLKDISRMEMDSTVKSHIQDNLRKISSPERLATPLERERWATLQNELKTRAASGDQMAKAILTAGKSDQSAIMSQVQMMSAGRPTMVSTKTGIFAPSVSEVLPTSLTQGAPVSYMKSLSVSSIASQTKTSTGNVNDIMQVLSSTSSGMLTQQQTTDTAKKLNISAEKVQDVISVIRSQSKAAEYQAFTSNIARESKLSESNVREILQIIPSSGEVSRQKVGEVSKNLNITPEKVQEVVAIVKLQSKAQTARQEQAVAKKGATPIPVSIGGKTVPAQVSVEDYEEVKKMWLNHYREAPIPVSDVIKERDQWLDTEEKKLTNITNLLSSANEQQKAKGLEQVAEILPFMLLGGFSNVEILTYIKAKLEALKQVLTELKLTKKAKEEAKKELEKEEEETLVEVEGKKEEKAQVRDSEAREMEIPEEDKDKSAPDNKSEK